MIAERHHKPCRHKYYWMSCVQFDALFEIAGGVCQLCGVAGEVTPHGLLHIDHDETVGAHGVRGLLCSRCNTMLGTQRGPVSGRISEYLGDPYWRAAGLRPLRTRRDLRLIVAGRTR